jgi:GNAT superfamily N-acetyltransferase
LKSTLSIRLAGDDDAAAVSRVLLEAFKEYQPLYTSGGFSATTPDETRVLQRMKEGPVWVALLDGACVGTGAAVLQGEALYIRGMAVLPDARGLRIGETLLKEIEKWAAAQNCTQLTLSTTPFLARAIRLYESFGFERTDEPLDLFGTPLIKMQRHIKRHD